jgi:hypothetical protein
MKAHTLVLGALLTALSVAPTQAQDRRYDPRQPDWQHRDRDHWRYEPAPRYYRPGDRRLYEPPEVTRSYPPEWAQPPSTTPGDNRTVWAYAALGGGHWQYQGNGRWAQICGDGPFYYRETGRTPEYVEMHDDNRGLTVRLCNDRYFVRNDNDAQWTAMLVGDGHWQQ